MSIKRRDNKNRVLRNGESQRKDGRYCYKYLDATGKSKYVYSWKLEASDKLPKGKKDCVSLREKEKEIAKDIADGIINSNMTVLELFEKYKCFKNNKKYNTKKSYNTVLAYLKKYKLGAKKIKNVSTSDAKIWLLDMQKDGYKYGTITFTKTVIGAAFKMAAEDNLIRKNPFSFPLGSVMANNTEKRTALTDEQEQDFLSFIRNSKKFSKYYIGVFILLNTGLRISELAGLTLDDIDMDNRVINVNHQLQKCGANIYRLTSPKTKSSKRQIPMSNEVYQCLKQQTEICLNSPHKCSEEGHSYFLFSTKFNNPTNAATWDALFSSIRKAYNKEHPDNPLKISPHICRHTFCSKLIKKGISIKGVQYLMGHTKADITLNIYTHFTFSDIKEDFDKVMNK